MTISTRPAQTSDIDSIFDVRTSVVENHLSREEMQQLGITYSIVCASPGYVKANGTANKPSDLLNHARWRLWSACGVALWFAPCGLGVAGVT